MLALVAGIDSFVIAYFFGWEALRAREASR